METRFLLPIVSFLFLVPACGRPIIDMSAMQLTPSDSQTAEVPKFCEYLYETKSWEIAVLEFKNNTGYGQGVVGGSSSLGTGLSRTETVGTGFAIGGPHAALGAGVSTSNTAGVWSEDSSLFLTEFAPSLNTFAQSVTEDTLASIGGVSVLSRSQMENILKEQQFQMTLADTDTIMELGKLSGVKYIFTGSVDNIETKYIAPTALDGGDSPIGLMVSIVSAGVDMAQQGWYVTVSFTLNLIDAETGKILYSKRFKDSGRATQSYTFQPNLVINAAKGLFSSAVTKARDELSNIFEIKGYINEMRGGKRIAKINLGSAKGIKEGDVFDLYEIYSSTDFLTKEQKCSMSKTGAKLTIADQVSASEAWGFVSGKDKQKEKVKIGTLAVRSSLAE